MVTHESFIWIRCFEVFGEDSGGAVEGTVISPRLQVALWDSRSFFILVPDPQSFLPYSTFASEKHHLPIQIFLQV